MSATPLAGGRIQLAWAAPGRAMDLGGWMVPRIGDLKYNFNYEGSYSPSQAVQGQDSDEDVMNETLKWSPS